MMRNKKSRIIATLFLLGGLAVCVGLAVRQDADWSLLMRENVEALTASENNNPNDICQKAGGYCLLDDIGINGISLKK